MIHVIRCIFSTFNSFNSLISSTDFTPNAIINIIINIGIINTILYINIYIAAMLNEISFDDKYDVTTTYGPDVQGNKNKLIKKPIKNAQIGEVTPFSNLNILGLHAVGTSILKYLPYQK